MARVRFKEILLLSPLLFVWIMFQISHYNKRTKIPGETNDRNFDFRSSNSTGGRRRIFNPKPPVGSELSWLPPDLLDKNYDDDSPEFLKPNNKHTENAFPKKLWFMQGGSIRPEQLSVNSQKELWPEHNKGDRIVQQLMYSPKNYSNEWSVPSPLAKIKLYDSHKSNLKKILLIGNFMEDQIPPGRSIFWQHKCPVNTCTFVSTLEAVRNTDAVIFKGTYLRGVNMVVRRTPDQVWILYLLDPPINELGSMKYVINWTASYRRDSDIVTPYGKFVPYYTTSLYTSEEIYIRKTSNKNYAANKTKKIAWFPSNCESNNDSLQYARKLSRYIEVDIYGPCGTKKCKYSLAKRCLDLLHKDYKFYLSFENHSCKDYITEKFFEHGLGYNMLPIVMGPPREDYERIAPPYSFIHVDDFTTPVELADYLDILDTNDNLYNEYFSWKGTGELINTHFWCRLCAMLHSPLERKSYEDIEKWWSPPGVCKK